MLLTIVSIAVVLGGLIFFHELGHFAVARFFGMGATTFSLGFGPKLLKKKWGKTEYCLSLVPLGGYVALVGETDENEIPEGFTEEECFSQRPAWQRLLVVLAGPMANIVMALILCWALAVGWGIPVMLPEIGGILPETAAAEAGLQVGDRINSINGKAIASWDELTQTISNGNGAPLELEIVRSDAARGADALTTVKVTVTPRKGTRTTIFGDTETAWMLGVRPSQRSVTQPVPFGEGFAAGAAQAWRMVSLTWQSFLKLAQGAVPMDQVGGPIAIGDMVGKAAHMGLDHLLFLTALISVNLGVLNLLPVPVLDGGTIVFCTLEILFRRPLNKKFQEYAMRAGVVLLVGLMILATFNDIWRLIKS